MLINLHIAEPTSEASLSFEERCQRAAKAFEGQKASYENLRALEGSLNSLAHSAWKAGELANDSAPRCIVRGYPNPRGHGWNISVLWDQKPLPLER